MEKKIGCVGALLAMAIVVFGVPALVMWGYSSIAWDFNLPYLSYWQVFAATWAIKTLLTQSVSIKTHK